MVRCAVSLGLVLAPPALAQEAAAPSAARVSEAPAPGAAAGEPTAPPAPQSAPPEVQSEVQSEDATPSADSAAPPSAKATTNAAESVAPIDLPPEFAPGFEPTPAPRRARSVPAAEAAPLVFRQQLPKRAVPPADAAPDEDEDVDLRDEVLRAVIRSTQAEPAAPPESDTVEGPEAATRSEAEPSAPEPPAVDDATYRSISARSPLFDLDERAQRIALFRLPPASDSDDSLLPPDLRRKLLRRWAATLEDLAAYEAAERAYQQVVQLEPGAVQMWRGLGRSRVRAGSWRAAEAAFLSALDAAEADESIEGRVQRAAVLRELCELYLVMNETGDAYVAIEESLSLNPNDARAAALHERARFEFDPTHEPPSGTVVALWPETAGERRHAQFEALLSSLSSLLPPVLREALYEQGQALTRGPVAKVAFGVAGVLFLVFVVLRFTRGYGDLVVTIDYPAELKGTFSIYLNTQQGQIKRSARKRVESKTSTRTEHYLIARETQFRQVRPGSYWVVIDGLLSDPETEQILTDPFEEASVQVQRGKTARFDIDVGPKECPVDVRVLWDKRPANDAGVAVRGLPQSLRYAKGGDLRLRLRKGVHTIMVGSGDRVAEQQIDVDSFAATEVVFELADSDALSFKGCPLAVEPYLHGDLSAAARALERDGQTKPAHLLLATLHEEQNQPRRAAEQLEAAGEFARAAKLRESISQFSQAGDLYRRAGEDVQAGEMYRKAGDWPSAGEAFESAGDTDMAVHCFKQAGETNRWIAALEKAGRYFEAAQGALENEDKSRATQLFQKVGMTDSDYAASCLELVAIYESEGEFAKAIERLEAHIEQSEETSADTRARLANLLEEVGNYQKALSSLEQVQTTNPDFPNIETRIESLKRKQSQQELSDSAPTAAGDGSTSDVVTAFLQDRRYELLEELGRGGMGVVYKARDTRLNRIVALKRLPENLKNHPKAIQLFLREAQAAARLNHRNIVTVYDTDHEDGYYFITMELLEGRPLNAILKEKGKLNARDVARLGFQVASGLQYAHAQRVVHRDIKTANLFITMDRTIKIMDFGLAKMVEEVRKESTVIGGTPYYMAPEQAIGEAVDHRTDLYALGITFYELLTGSVPFKDGDITYHHRHTPAPDPRTVVPEIPAAMAELVMHMIEKQMTARVASAAEIAQRLEPIARS